MASTAARPHVESRIAALLATVSWTTLASLVLAGALLGVTSSSAAAEGELGLVLDHGHIDAFTVVAEDGSLGVRLQEDVTGHHVLHDASDVLLRVKEKARITLPDPVPSALAFLGGGGDEVYFLPQTQDPDLIWPGWSTERVPAADFTGPLRIHVDAVDGPGRAYQWQTGSFGESTPVLDSGGYRLPGTITAAANSHVHANWAFTAPGRYTLSVRATGTRVGGAVVESDPVTYAFEVGDADPTPSPTPTPTPDPTPTPTPDPTPDPTPTPEPGGAWNVPNGTVNRSGATVLNRGHVDIASLLDDETLATKVKDTTGSATPVWRDPATTVLQLLPSSKATVPANAAYSFLGSAGSTFYQVTQTQQPGLLWPGWSTESIPVADTTGGVLWALTDKSGPGEFAIYETDSFGRPKVLFDTRDGIGAADRFTIPKNTHAHGSWAFSEEGTYCLSMQRVAQLATGATVSDQFVLAVAVGRADVMHVDPTRCGERVDTDPPVVGTPRPDKDPDKDPGTGPGKSGGKTPGAGNGTDGRADEPGRPGQQTGQPPCVAQAPGPSGSRATVLSAGHIDYASRIVGGRLQSSVGDDTSGSKVYREPSETVLWLKPGAKVTLPAGYGQVGPPGSVVWQVPQTQNPALIWLGWSTEQLNAGNVRGPVTWRLDEVRGPGTVKVYLSGSFGGVQRMVLAGAGSSYTIELGVHAHANWAFSKQGVYRLTTTQSVTLANGTRSTDTEVLTIAVGDVDPTTAARGDGPATTGADAGADDDCVAAVTAGSSGSDDDLVAAPQAAAPLAPTGVVAIGTGTETGTGSGTVVAVGPARESDPVPPLLGALGGLLLVGAAGTGILWWRAAQRPALTATRVSAVA